MDYALNALFLIAALLAIAAIGLSLRDLVANRHRLRADDAMSAEPRLRWLNPTRTGPVRPRMHRHPAPGRSPMNRLPRHVRHPDAA